MFISPSRITHLNRAILSGIAGTPTPPSTFSPTDLILPGDVGGYYKLYDWTTLRQNSGGTGTVAAAGDPVGQSIDEGGSFNATQATGTARPLAGRHPAGPRRNELNASTDLTDGGFWVNIGASRSNAGSWSEGNITAVASGGANFHSARASLTTNFLNLSAGEEVSVGVIYQAGTSPNCRIEIRDDTNSVSSFVNGAVGSLSVASQAAGTITNLSQTVLSPGVLLCTFTFTQGSTGGTVLLGVGPNSPVAGETVLVRAVHMERAATIGALQYVRAPWDITEEGGTTLTGIYTDGLDDVLAADIDLGGKRAVTAAVAGFSNNPSGAGRIIRHNGGANRIEVYSGGGGTVIGTLYNLGNVVSVAAPANFGIPTAVVSAADADAPELKLRTSQGNNNQLLDPGAGTFFDAKFFIGAGTASSLHWPGFITAAFIVDRQLNDTEIADLLAYLEGTVGI